MDATPGDSCAMRETLTTLGLNGISPLAAALRPVIDGALIVLCDELFDDALPAHRRLRGQLEDYRRAIAEATDGDQITPIADACIATLATALRETRDRPVERRQELASLIALVKDAIALLTGDHDTFSSDLGRTADRFDALVATTNLQHLKDLLKSEVMGLRQLVAERQQQWRTTASMLESRIAALETQLDVVRHEVMRDPLTGVGNRRRFETALAAHIGPPPRPFVVALFDVDDFKRINDTGGHLLGDRKLQELAHALDRSVRSDDILARLGGDEFVLLAGGQTLPQMEGRLRSLVSMLAGIESGLDQPTHITTSCGAVEYCAGDTAQSVMKRADQALYEAKRQGKNRLALKSPPFIRDLLRR